MSTPTASTGAAPEVLWHALTPDDVASRQKVDPSVGLTSAEADARRSTYGKNTFAEAKKASRWQTFSRQYADPMQIVLLVAGIVCLFLPGQFYTGVFLILLTLFNAWMAMNQEGKAEASASALQSMMVVNAKVRRNGELAEIPMDRARPGRCREHRGGRPRARGCTDPVRGDPRDRRVGAHGRERAHPQAGGRRRRGRRPRGPGGHGVHELPGDPRGRHRSSSRRRGWRPRSATSAGCCRSRRMRRPR